MQQPPTRGAKIKTLLNNKVLERIWTTWNAHKLLMEV